MISKETFLKALENYRSVCADQLISDSNLRIRQGNFEYIISFGLITSCIWATARSF